MTTKPLRMSFLLMTVSGLLCTCSCSDMAKTPLKPTPTPTAVPSFIPEKSSWNASASALQKPDKHLAHEAIDGNLKTRWSSPNSQPNWLEIDMGREADIFGCTIFWETAFASAYNIEISIDGNSWQEVYKTRDGDGKTDEIYFRHSKARYLRINATERGTPHWGFSIYEVDIKGADEQALVHVEGQDINESMYAFDGTAQTIWTSPTPASCSIDIDLRNETDLGGIWIQWGDHFATKATLFTSQDGTNWDKAARLQDGTGGKDMLLHKDRKARYIRLQIDETSGSMPVEIADMSLCSPGEYKNSLLKYNFVAKKHHRGIYPLQFRKEQVYWTLVGLPGDHAESLVDELGNFEPYRKAGSLQPYLEIDNQLICGLDAPVLEHSMEDGYLPLPLVRWHTTPIRVDIRAMAHGKEPDSASYVLYTLKNVSSTPQKGRFFLVIRPVQINPSWQFGGISPIESLAYKKVPEGLGIFVNHALQYVALTPPAETAARAFEQGDIIEDLLRQRFPQSSGLENAGREISGALAYELDLAPGEEKNIVIAAPLHDSPKDIHAFAQRMQNNPKLAKPTFTNTCHRVAQQWHSILDRVTIEIPEQQIVDTVKAQIAYIMLNRDGPAIQPGSRNYKRAFMRDGCLTSGALLRMGLTNEVRAYLDWYSQRVDKDGWVPPILNRDGSINKGFGWNNEYDSQGEYLFAMMQYYQFTKDDSLIKKHFNAIEGAMKYLVALRNQTLVPGYMNNEEAPERFVGVLPKSISHEGYDPPVHSYWDMFFALKGLKDGAEASRIAGRNDVAHWADEQYRIFRESMRDSMLSTIAWRDIDHVPACAEYADCDPTSTAIAFFPCEEEDILPEKYMRQTYENYYNSFKARLGPHWHGYTPYEIRIIPALIELGHKERAKQVLDSIISHCRPRGWNHLTEVVFKDMRNGSYIGDMPHTWIGAGIVNSVRFMLAHENDDTLVLLQGIPQNWVESNGLHIQNMPTHFGVLNMRARMRKSTFGIALGGTIKPENGIDVFWPKAGKPVKVLVDDQECTDYNDLYIHVPAGTRTIKAVWPAD